jgi:hypothetical protein
MFKSTNRCSFVLRSGAAVAFLVGACGAKLPDNYKGRPFVDPLFNEDGVQEIPGKLETAYYDLGGEGVGYHEITATYDNDPGNAAYTLNKQYKEDNAITEVWSFRKDEAVDISYTKTKFDYGGNKVPYSYALAPEKQLYPGWAHPGEWINYTVHVKYAGTYRMRALYSRKDCNSSLVINNDEAHAVKFNLPKDVEIGFPGAQYSYHQWIKDYAGTITFADTGLQLLTLKIGAPEVGTNYGYFQFDYVKPTEPGNHVPATYKGRAYYDNLVEVDSIKSSDGKYQGTAQSIPGLLQPHLYDLGGEGVAYHDMDAANQGVAFNDKNGCSNESNSSYVCGFRKNDGVDISNTLQGPDYSHTNFNIPLQGRFYLGWTQSGEWTNYSVNVDKPGVYRVKAMYAGKDNPLSFVVNGKDTSRCKLPLDTKGVNIWKRADSIGTVTFSDSGYNLLTLVPGDGNSFQSFKFYYVGPVPTSQVAVRAPATADHGVRQISRSGNFVAVRYSAREAGHAQVALINSQGVRVRNTLWQNLSKGDQTRSLDVRGLGHGVFTLLIRQGDHVQTGRIELGGEARP